jgi:signal transduction histidine kinase
MADGSPMSDDSIASYFRGQDAERRRIGQELHDSTGQLLLVLRLNILQLHSAHSEHSPGLLDEMTDTIHAIESEIRTISFLHYPKELDGGGLAQAIHSLATGFGKRAGIEAQLEIDPEAAGATHAVGQGLYRIAQEALVNVHRHSRATRIAVRLKAETGLIKLIIDDNGVGVASCPTLETRCGVGLSSMRQRAELLGGQLSVHRLRQGTRVLAIIPTEPVPVNGMPGAPHSENASLCSPQSRFVARNLRQRVATPAKAMPCPAELLMTL